jgi:hypothetical protein
MQANLYGHDWYWESCLQFSVDNPYSPFMSFDYPWLFYQGIVPHSGFPQPIYGGTIPTAIPYVGGNQWVCPSSMGGYDAYMNIFAVGAGSWLVPSTLPFYGWQFGFTQDCPSAMTLPSYTSVVEFVWMNKGPNNQYTTLDGNTPDCMGGAGNKCRNYSLISDADNGYFWAWTNGCTGVQEEWAQCLFVCDAVTIPVNSPGAPNGANPYAVFGFDVGVATMMPYFSSDGYMLSFMTEDYTGLGGSRIALAAFRFSDPCVGPYGNFNYRIPHGWDQLTDIFVRIPHLFMHTPVPGYPACMFGFTVGAHSNSVHFSSDPSLYGAEIRWSTYATGKNMPFSASFMTTFF